jgi:hypothetical protein
LRISIGVWNVETATMLMVVAAQTSASLIIYQVGGGLCASLYGGWLNFGLPMLLNSLLIILLN